MSFVYPNFLWAFFVLLIPIIVHLFNFRRYKTIYFSRVKFLKEVVEDSKSGAKLKHLLVLLTRLLFLSALILAFAQPFIPTESGEQTKNLTSIYIDNSFSMQADGVDGDLLNEVKNKAIEIVKSIENDEKINLLTTDMLSVQQRFYSKAEILDMIKGIEFSARSTSLNEILRLQADLLKNVDKDANQRIFLFSDFQSSTSELTTKNIPEIQTYFYQAKSVNPENLYIDSVWFETPVHRTNTPVDVHFRVRNLSDNPVNDLAIRLSINGNEPGPKRLTIPAQSFVDEVITFTDRTAGVKTAKLSIETGQLFFDDDYYFSYTIKESVNILLVSTKTETNLNLAQLYNLDPYYQTTVKSIENIVPEDFKDQELVILNNIDRIPGGIMELLDDKLKNGGSIALIPGVNADLNNWNTYLSRHQIPNLGSVDTNSVRLNYFNDVDPLYAGVFTAKPENYKYPVISKHYRPVISGSHQFITLFGSSKDHPFLLYNNSGIGNLTVMYAPLDLGFSNFQNHALFAATFLRIAETATFSKPLYMTIGNMQNFPLHQFLSEKNPIHLINESAEVDIIPLITNIGNAQAISFSHLEDALSEAGFYTLTDHQNFEEVLGLNYDRQESDIKSFNNTEILNNFKNMGWNKAKKVSLTGTGDIQINQIKATEYWRILLILAVLFIGIEILLLKFWKS